MCIAVVVRGNFLGIPGNQHFDTGKHQLSYYRARAAPACVASVLDTLPAVIVCLCLLVPSIFVLGSMRVLARALNVVFFGICAYVCSAHFRASVL